LEAWFRWANASSIHATLPNETRGVGRYHNLCPALESSDIYTWDGTQCPGEDLGDATYSSLARIVQARSDPLNYWSSRSWVSFVSRLLWHILLELSSMLAATPTLCTVHATGKLGSWGEQKTAKIPVLPPQFRYQLFQVTSLVYVSKPLQMDSPVSPVDNKLIFINQIKVCVKRTRPLEHR